jgi:hypothetical protein
MTTFGTSNVGIIFSSFFGVQVLTSVVNKQRHTISKCPNTENVSFIQTEPPAAVIRVLETYLLSVFTLYQDIRSCMLLEPNASDECMMRISFLSAHMCHLRNHITNSDGIRNWWPPSNKIYGTDLSCIGESYKHKISQGSWDSRIKSKWYMNIHSFIHDSTALCWGLASSSVSESFLHSR